MSGTLDRIPQLMHELHNQRASEFSSSYRDQYLTQIERQRTVSCAIEHDCPLVVTSSFINDSNIPGLCNTLPDMYI